MDQGPVLVITFQAQQIMAVKNSKGEVVEGSLVSIAFLIICAFKFLITILSLGQNSKVSLRLGIM